MNIVYRVTYENGETMHTGHKPLADVWAKRSGARIEEITLHSADTLENKKVAPLYNMDMPPMLITAINAFDDAIVDALQNVKDAGVHKGFIVGMLHAYAHKQTQEMVEDGYA